jgi:hypothetical protein
LQTDALTRAVLLVQVAAVHTILLFGKVHPVGRTPLQVPTHFAEVPAQAALFPRGAPLTVLHVPALPDSLHA